MKTIDDFAVPGRRVLVRDDLNVPLDGGQITDDGRIRAALPTLIALKDRGAKVIVCAHLGRPAGQPDPKYSLAPAAARLGELLGLPVTLAADVTGPSAQAAAAALPPGGVVLLRHGQSEWNAAGVFTGWANAHLTAQGELEAAQAGALLAEHGVFPDFAHTSLQRRTIRTADLVLAAADRDWIPVRRSWRLNGRHYGALQGRNKAEVVRQYGVQQVMLWRRSYDVPPPPLDGEAMSSQAADARYRGLPPDVLPCAESLADVTARLLPYWYDAIVPDLRAGGCVLVVSHNNTLRALVKYLEAIPDDRIAGLELPTGIPLVYQLGPGLRPDALGGQYPDPHAARDGIQTRTVLAQDRP